MEIVQENLGLSERWIEQLEDYPVRNLRRLPNRSPVCGLANAFISRCNIENMEDFEISMWNWARGSNYCNLTDEQYSKLKT